MPSVLNINVEDIDSCEKCRNYTVGVVECGEVGVLHACLFADAGFKVIGSHSNPHKLRLLAKGQALGSSREVQQKMKKYVHEGVFSVISDTRKTASSSDIIVVAAQTMIDEKKKPDYSLLEKVCREVGMGLKKGTLVLFVCATGPGILESSMCNILEKASGLRAGTEFALASSPTDSATLGSSSAACGNRVVGAVNASSLKVASRVLNRIVNSEILKVSNIRTVEALTLFRRAGSEINLALANELAVLCEKLKIDFLEVVEASNKDNMSKIPLPGAGNCTTRRGLRLLLEAAEISGSSLHLTHLASKINDEIKDYVFRLVKDALKECGKTVRRSKISVMGVSRFSNTKKPPDATTRNIISLLERKVRTIQVYDPFFSKKELAEFGYDTEKLSKVVEGTDCIVILVGHSRFKKLNLKKIKFLAKKSPAIVDISHVVDPSKAEKHGFIYRGLGRGIWNK